MAMNPRLDRLQPYPFERLARLLEGAAPPQALDLISLAIGEPQHAPPDAALDALTRALSGFSRYPATRGLPELRQAIADWLTRRFGLPAQSVDPDRHVMPVAGTREALFSFAQAVVRQPGAIVAMPNPGYQIYEGAAFLAGAEPLYLDCPADTGFLPDLDAVTPAQWQACDLLYLCSPGNPTGAVAPLDYLQHALALAERHDFVIASDECYSEIYPDESAPPAGLLEAAAQAGNTEFTRCMVFHSLSKRSNLPGLRSGFVAGDAAVLGEYARYRTYHGSTLPLPTQAASIAAWQDENHVRDNRAAYREKFAAVQPVLGAVMDVPEPQGAFYLWPALKRGDDEAFTRRALVEQAVRVVPGRYLARESGGRNPGENRLRLSLVAETQACREAAERLARLT